MRIDVTYTPQELRRVHPAGHTVVVIDVIRAATTLTTALANGCRAAVPVVSVAAARRAAAALAPKAPLLGGERGGLRIPGFDLGNSPREYTRAAVEGRVLVFTTTNGTATIHAANHAAEVVVGALVNLEAVVRHVFAAGRPVIFAAAGRGRRPVLDDTVAAGLMTLRLAELAGRAADLTDAAKIASRVALPYRPEPLQALRESASGRALGHLALDGDLAVCAQVNAYNVVPVMRGSRLVPA